MTWLEMANLLFEKSEALSPLGAHLHLDTAGWFRTWTPYQNRAADDAASFFSQHRHWPAMAPEPAAQLYFRCLFAIEICFDSHQKPSKAPNSRAREELALKALLIDQWQQQGLGWAERRYARPVHRASRVVA